MDGYLRGRTAEYANFTMLFVDDRWKRKGIGSRLFQEIAKCAREKGAKKLFLSAIPAVETIQFYLSLGCVDAEERIESYIDTAEDRCLEYKL
ncbi:MAG TPA: GNAT family N-acetyltransferase [Candidatus Limivivens intestinipullorum]|uniref:GNAT family N-acetyltransferase n=1 Tax=Candidatus Limivivens intestinipullorum TaxID=2840858 RepID=A0A9D1ERN6_9FIRM|nr:GNAT family N-acetyltransferase [Candidatus Limivivens intestinipullorum]